jgi:hypothetical protein
VLRLRSVNLPRFGMSALAADVLWEPSRPVVAAAGREAHLAVLDASEHAIAIELDLVQPLLARWGSIGLTSAIRQS